MDLRPLFATDDTLEFTAVEVTTDGEELSVLLAAHAQQPVGLQLWLSQLTGKRVAHEAALITVGAPTVACVEALARAWSLDVVPTPRTAEPRRIGVTAIARWRETPKGPTPALTPKELKWERVRFEWAVLDRRRPSPVTLELELDLDQSRVALRVPAAAREALLQTLADGGA